MVVKKDDRGGELNELTVVVNRVWGWRKKIEKKFLEGKGEDSLDDATKDLIDSLCGFICIRWFSTLNRIQTVPEIFYRRNHINAMAAVIAILELIESVGEGKSMPDKYLKLIEQV